MRTEDKKILRSIGHRLMGMAEEINEILDNGLGKDFELINRLQTDLLNTGERIEFFLMKPKNRPNAKPDKAEIEENRNAFLLELRTGNHKKGTIKSDDKGNPVFETEEDREGHCACAIMGGMFGMTENGKISLSRAAKALGINGKQCGYIQRSINDTPLTFPEMADRIEAEVFKSS